MTNYYITLANITGRTMYDERPSLTRRRLLASGAAVSVSVALAGCPADDPEIDDDDDTAPADDTADDTADDDPDTVEQTIHITQQVEPQHDYDPVVLNDAYSGRIANHFFDGLYEFDEGFELQPKLAVDYPEVERDGTRYIFEITDEAEFHNGDPVTAEDVLHSFLAPPVEETRNAPSYGMIDLEESTTIDDTTVQIDLTEQYGPFTTQTMAVDVVNKEARLESLGMTEDEWWDAEGDPGREAPYNRENPIGSGPFRYVDHTDGEFLDMERWDDYWDDPLPELESVRWVATEDDAARVSQILAGDTDFITGLPPEDWEDVDANDDVDVYSELSISYFYMAFNCNEGPTVEADVRNGIEHAWSASDFVETVIGPAGARMTAPAADQTLEAMGLDPQDYAALENEYDPEQAADLIGPHLDGTWEPRLIAPPDDIRVSLCERVAARLGELEEYGVEIDPQVQRLDWAEFGEAYLTGDEDDYAAYTLGWTGGADPDFYIFPLFHESAEGLSNGTYYQPDTDFHDNIQAARQSVDEDERADLYDEIFTEILEETVHSPTYTMMNSIAAQPHVQDAEVHPHSSIKPRLVSGHHNVNIQ